MDLALGVVCVEASAVVYVASVWLADECVFGGEFVFCSVVCVWDVAEWASVALVRGAVTETGMVEGPCVGW